MSKLALGIIEAVGLAAAIEAADVAAKSANIQIIGYELTKGDGMATVKIAGTVGAVKAAVDAAVSAASKINKLFGKSIIARPSDGLDILIHNDETVGIQIKQREESINFQQELEDGIVFNMEEEDGNREEFHDEGNEYGDKTQEFEGCNLCKDPECSRRKGDLRSMCIHYGELKNEGRFHK